MQARRAHENRNSNANANNQIKIARQHLAGANTSTTSLSGSSSSAALDDKRNCVNSIEPLASSLREPASNDAQTRVPGTQRKQCSTTKHEKNPIRVSNDPLVARLDSCHVLSVKKSIAC
jgi:hypothetical protein